RVVIKGLPPASRSDLMEIVSQRLAEYDVTSGAENTWILSMKPSQLADLKNKAVAQAIETIRNRIDSLGVAEPVIQEHGLGQYQILVQLPGVDDPARVQDIMQSTAMLQIKQVLSGPYASEQEALQQSNGVLPPNSMLLKGRSVGSKTSNDAGEEYYIVTRSSAVAGADLRPGGASVGRDSNTNTPDVGFLLTNAGGRKFAAFTGAHVGDRLAVVLDNRVREV